MIFVNPALTYVKNLSKVLLSDTYFFGCPPIGAFDAFGILLKTIFFAARRALLRPMLFTFPALIFF